MAQRLRLIIALCVIAVLYDAPASRADLVLDQSFTPPSFEGNVQIFDRRPSAPFFQELAQTFTVGLAGELSAVDVHITGYSTSGSLFFDVRSATGGVPREADAPVLVSRTIAAADVVAANGDGQRDYFRIDFSGSAISVTPGQSLAIVLRTTPGVGYTWSGVAAGGYGGGAGLYRGTNQPTWGGSFGDMGFRTYVDVAAIPEPSPLVLMTVGALGLLGHGGRRRACRRV